MVNNKLGLTKEQASQNSDARAHAIVDSAIDAIITIDEWSVVETVNPAAEKMFGYQPGELVGANVRVLMPPPFRDDHDAYLHTYRATGVKRIIDSGREAIAVRKDGALFPIELAVSEARLAGRRIFIGAVRDITARKELERRILEDAVIIRNAHEETISYLLKASIYRDWETGAHIQRTGWSSELLGKAAGWSAEQADLLRLAASMHDIGKIGVPDAILRKPGPLTPTEQMVMRTHTTIGAKMLAGATSPVLRLAHEIALYHHERWDGHGYPARLAGCDIPEAARIVTIVDDYDALTHDRVYRRGYADSDALAIMQRGRGTHFDPDLFDLFLSVLPGIRAIAAVHPDAADTDQAAQFQLANCVADNYVC